MDLLHKIKSTYNSFLQSATSLDKLSAHSLVGNPQVTMKNRILRLLKQEDFFLRNSDVELYRGVRKKYAFVEPNHHPFHGFGAIYQSHRDCHVDFDLRLSPTGDTFEIAALESLSHFVDHQRQFLLNPDQFEDWESVTIFRASFSIRKTLIVNELFFDAIGVSVDDYTKEPYLIRNKSGEYGMGQQITQAVAEFNLHADVKSQITAIRIPSKFSQDEKLGLKFNVFSESVDLNTDSIRKVSAFNLTEAEEYLDKFFP